MVLNDLELDGVNILKDNVVLGPGVDAILAQNHVVGLVGGLPVAAEEVGGTCYGVAVFYHGTILNLNGIQTYGLVLQVEDEGQVVGAALIEEIVLVITIGGLAPVGAPTMILDNLVLQV